MERAHDETLYWDLSELIPSLPPPEWSGVLHHLVFIYSFSLGVAAVSEHPRQQAQGA